MKRDDWANVQRSYRYERRYDRPISEHHTGDRAVWWAVCVIAAGMVMASVAGWPW